MRRSSKLVPVVALLAGACGGGGREAPLADSRGRADAAAPSIVATPSPVSTDAKPSTASSPTSAVGDPAKDGGVAEDSLADVRASNAFTAKLVARLAHAGNQMVSGTSLRAALGVAYLGARNETAREMASALELPAEPAALAAVAKVERAAWQDARGRAELFVANRLWADASFAMKDDFTNLAGATFGAAVERTDFARSPDAARRTINAWVSSMTASRITDLLAEGALDKRTRAVITNAIYFKGRWASPFPRAATRDEPWRSGAATVGPSLPMMHDTGRYRFAQVGAAKVLAMPYEGSRLAMLVVVPDDVAGLGKLEAELSADAFDTWTKTLAMQRVAVTLPKFAFRWGAALSVPLQELGMRAAFSSRADFGAITDASPGAVAEPLQISQVVQRTWIAVDEVGTEAAAATGVAMSTTSLAMGPIVELKADHPFLFFVYDDQRGRILFAGRVTDPRPRGS